jgi:gas vesicle protein
MKKFLLGMLGGVSLGMLFAPEKGDKLRKKLAKSDSKLVDFGKEMLSAGKEASEEVKAFLEKPEVKEFLEKGKANASDLFEKGKDLSAKGKKEVESLAKKASEKVKGFEGEELLEDIKNFFSSDEDSKKSKK